MARQKRKEKGPAPVISKYAAKQLKNHSPSKPTRPQSTNQPIDRNSEKWKQASRDARENFNKANEELNQTGIYLSKEQFNATRWLTCVFARQKMPNTESNSQQEKAAFAKLYNIFHTEQAPRDVFYALIFQKAAKNPILELITTAFKQRHLLEKEIHPSTTITNPEPSAQ